MNTTKKLMCILTAGVALSAASPVFADSFHDRGYDRHSYRDYDRHVYRDYDRHHLVVVQRPYFVQRPYIIEQPVYYNTQPAANFGVGAMIGAAIGTIYDNRQ